MQEDFDPYLAWLNIPATSRPPNHYQLLGLPEFEADASKILAAADQRMAQIRSYQTGPRGKYTQKLLNELSSAKLCLLDPIAKNSYDQSLAQQRVPVQMHQAPTSVYFAPPTQEPPVTPPPAKATKLRPKFVTSAEDKPPEREPSTAWMWAAMAICICIIVGSSLAMIFYGPQSLKPITEVPPDPPAINIRAEPPPAENEIVEIFHLVQEGNGDLGFANSLAELSEGLTRIDRDGAATIEGWKGETSMARWNFTLVKPAVFEIRIEYIAQNASGAQWQLRIGEETKLRDLQVSEEDGATVADAFFWRIPRGGEHTLDLSILQLPADAEVTLKSLRFVYQGGQLK